MGGWEDIGQHGRMCNIMAGHGLGNVSGHGKTWKDIGGHERILKDMADK